MESSPRAASIWSGSRSGNGDSRRGTAAGVERLLDSRDVDVVEGTARFVKPDRILVEQHGAFQRDPRHPPTLYVREDALLPGIFRFLGERVFGPNRRELLHADLEILDDEPMRKNRARIKALRRAIEAIEARQARQVRNLEMDDDPDGIMFRQIRDRSTSNLVWSPKRASGIFLKPYASKSATTSLTTRRSAGSLSATM